MVGAPGDGRARRLVEELSTADLADGFLLAKARYCAPNTVRKYRWALLCLERAYPILPRVTQEIIHFVQAEPLGSNNQRVLYETIQELYRWTRANRDPLVPELPNVGFGRRRVGERRGRKGRGL